MTDPNPPRADRGQRAGGIALGMFLAVLLGALGVSALVNASVILGVLVAAGFFSAFFLVSRDDAFRRGLGVGLLLGAALDLLLVGACFAILAGLDV